MLPHLSDLSGATGNSSGSTAAAGESAAGADGANGGAAAEAAGFDSYAGPVFSLLTTEEMPLTAERTVTWSFPSASSSTTQMQDTYLIHNDSDTACTVTAYYPFSASLDTLSRFSPAVTLDGQPGGHRFGDGRLCRDLYRCLAGRRVWTTPHGIWLRPGSGRTMRISLRTKRIGPPP